MRSRESATFLGYLIFLLIVTSPFWLVFVLGLLAPFLIAAFLVAIPIGVVYNAVKK
jgi:hypothetical protein